MKIGDLHRLRRACYEIERHALEWHLHIPGLILFRENLHQFCQSAPSYTWEAQLNTMKGQPSLQGYLALEQHPLTHRASVRPQP